MSSWLKEKKKRVRYLAYLSLFLISWVKGWGVEVGEQQSSVPSPSSWRWTQGQASLCTATFIALNEERFFTL